MSSKKGFAGMPETKQTEIASKGGKAAQASGHAHRWTSEKAREAGRKGGLKVSADREHMAAIGRKGGATVSANREHMAAIGKMGGRPVNESSDAAASDDSTETKTLH